LMGAEIAGFLREKRGRGQQCKCQS
jgi:hypothetical protein